MNDDIIAVGESHHSVPAAVVPTYLHMVQNDLAIAIRSNNSSIIGKDTAPEQHQTAQDDPLTCRDTANLQDVVYTRVIHPS